MSKEHESADLILKLYDLRREALMRKAREWYFTFNPETVEDVGTAARGENSAYFRMVVSYWDMACSLVNNGAIDEKMFADATGEQNFVFAKLHPFITQIREVSKQPNFLAHLEKYVMRQPDAEQRMEALRAMSKQMNAQRATATAAGQSREEAASA
jgi:hypothetical protein